jgi:hypothetical protein
MSVGCDRVDAGSAARVALVGRGPVLAEVDAHLADGRSVLLVGPSGSGKSAVIDAVGRPGLIVVDPFARITTPRACAIRRALDRGRLVAGAATSVERREMGHVGRIFWRLEIVYVRPLPSHQIRSVFTRLLLAGDAAVPISRTWLAEAVEVANGLPGRAVSLASVVIARWRERRQILPPRFALAVAWQDALFQTGAAPLPGSRKDMSHEPGPRRS